MYKHPVDPVLAKQFEKLFTTQTGLSGIGQDKIFEDHLIKHNKRSSEKTTKMLITKSINIIRSKHKKYKIGKTGNPKGRGAGYDVYDMMLLLCQASNEATINQLEAYYNEKYKDDNKNENKRIGSAGRCVSVNKQYYLYVVVR